VEITLEVLYYRTLCETKFDLILFYVGRYAYVIKAQSTKFLSFIL